MKHYGICPASCGEFVQGILKDKEYLSSYAIDMYSIATIEEKAKDINRGPEKSRKSIESIFKYFNIPIEESKNLSLEIDSKIPIGKGMASSTADIGATIKATLEYLNKNMTMEEISQIVAQIEPTDSIYIEKNCIFNPLDGKVHKYLGEINSAKVIILEPNTRLRTTKIRRLPNYNELKIKNKELIEGAFYSLEEGICDNNLFEIGRACTISSLANENILKKPGLKEIIEISQNYGACGVNIGHSGTVVGIIIEDWMNDLKLIEKLKECNLHSFYKRIYTKNIVKGGLRGDNYGLHQESYAYRRKKF